MTKHTHIRLYAQDPALEDFADELLEVFGVLNRIVARMIRAEGGGHPSPDRASIPDLARSTVAEALKGVQLRYSRRDLKVAVSIVAEATQAISENAFLADSDLLQDGGPEGEQGRADES